MHCHAFTPGYVAHDRLSLDRIAAPRPVYEQIVNALHPEHRVSRSRVRRPHNWLPRLGGDAGRLLLAGRLQSGQVASKLAALQSPGEEEPSSVAAEARKPVMRPAGPPSCRSRIRWPRGPSPVAGPG